MGKNIFILLGFLCFFNRPKFHSCTGFTNQMFPLLFGYRGPLQFEASRRGLRYFVYLKSSPFVVSYTIDWDFVLLDLISTVSAVGLREWISFEHQN